MNAGRTSYMGDDYAEYYTKAEYDELLNSNSGTFIGMGVLVSDQGNSTFIITEVYDNTPAKEAGILVGDQLIRANGEPAEGKDLSEFLGFVTHGEGDVNTVVVLRDGQELTFTVTMPPPLAASYSAADTCEDENFALLLTMS